MGPCCGRLYTHCVYAERKLVAIKSVLGSRGCVHGMGPGPHPGQNVPPGRSRARMRMRISLIRGTRALWRARDMLQTCDIRSAGGRSAALALRACDNRRAVGVEIPTCREFDSVACALHPQYGQRCRVPDSVACARLARDLHTSRLWISLWINCGPICNGRLRGVGKGKGKGPGWPALMGSTFVLCNPLASASSVRKSIRGHCNPLARPYNRLVYVKNDVQENQLNTRRYDNGS